MTLSDIFSDVWGEIEWVGVIIGAVAYFALGGIWYARAVFGEAWIRLSGVRPDTGMAPAALAVGFITGFVSALAIGFLAVLARVADPIDGVLLGLVIGVAFGLFQSWSNALFEQKSSQLVWINGGYNLVGLALVGLIIGIFS